MTFLQAAGIVVAILVVDLALSGDNALVIGSVAAKLQGRLRRQAILIGGLMAAVIRIILSVFAVYLLNVPFLQALGGIVVFVIAVQMLHEVIVDANAKDGDEKQSRRTQLTGNERLLRASLTILVADFSMSLDNVLVVAALARGYPWLLVIGLGLSIVLLLLASSLVAQLIEHFPILLYATAGILAWTAGSMILNDEKIHPIIAYLDQYVPGPLPNYIAPFFLVLLALLGIFFFNRERRDRHHQQNPSMAPASHPR